MIVECNSCHTKYNVDERKIPAAGVKVRCQKCQGLIIIRKPEPAVAPDVQPSVPASEPAAPPSVTPPPKTETPSAPPVTAPPEPPAVKPPTEPPPFQPPSAPEPPVVKSPAEPVTAAPPEEKLATEPYVSIPAAPPPAPAPLPEITEKPASALSEEDKKWHERARRLAKALASDLVLYNQDKVEQGLREGNLVDLLGSEIRRSWEYYCQQIPRHIVASTDFFKEQLNKIVCKGREIFK